MLKMHPKTSAVLQLTVHDIIHCLYYAIMHGYRFPL